MTATTFTLAAQTLAALAWLDTPCWSDAERLVSRRGMPQDQEDAVLKVLHDHTDHTRETGAERCPNCGKLATFTAHYADSVETHGLDCGPYEHFTEEWYACNLCGAETTQKEILG